MQEQELKALIVSLIEQISQQDFRNYYRLTPYGIQITPAGKADIELNYYLKTLATVINIKDQELKDYLKTLMEQTGRTSMTVKTGNYIMEIYAGSKDTITTHIDAEKMKRDGIYEQYTWQDIRKGHIKIVQKYDLNGYQEL